MEPGHTLQRGPGLHHSVDSVKIWKSVSILIFLQCTSLLPQVGSHLAMLPAVSRYVDCDYNEIFTSIMCI